MWRKVFSGSHLGRKHSSYSGLEELGAEDASDIVSEYDPSEGSSEWNEKHLGSKSSQQSRRLSARVISDATIGLSDGLTVPFALTAGLSAFGDSNVVIYGGMAELLAGSISMGLGGYLGAKSEAESSQNARSLLLKNIQRDPEQVLQRIRQAYLSADLPPELLETVTCYVQADDVRAVRFLSMFEENTREESFQSRDAYFSAITIAAGYFIGGFIPLLPYFFLHEIHKALSTSVIIMAVALFMFGYSKARLVGQMKVTKCVTSGVQMTVLGGCAAAVAVGCVKVGAWWEE